MGINDLKNYLLQFEQQVVCEGYKRGILGSEKRISVKRSSLLNTEFGIILGYTFAYNQMLAFDLYGHIKKSRGFFHFLDEVRKEHSKKQVKAIVCPVIHFAAIRFEEIRKLSPDLLLDFPDFKKTLLDLRGFNHNYEV